MDRFYSPPSHSVNCIFIMIIEGSSRKKYEKRPQQNFFSREHFQGMSCLWMYHIILWTELTRTPAPQLVGYGQGHHVPFLLCFQTVRNISNQQIINRYLFIHLIIVRTFTSKFKIKDMIPFKRLDCRLITNRFEKAF